MPRAFRGWEHPRVGNLRGGKGTLWEGGLRVPVLVEWPARLAKPAVSDVPCSTLDIYPTVLAATGAVAPQQIQPLDGVNLLPLFDRPMRERGKAIGFWADVRRPNAHATLLDWPFKLHTDASAGRGKKGALAPRAYRLGAKAPRLLAAAGESPVRRVKVVLKCSTVLKPTRSATSAMLSAVVLSSSSARAMRWRRACS